MANKWKSIVLHCSDSSFGNALMIDDWHRNERGWKKIGYHYVITNGHFFGNSEYVSMFDGVIEPGRNLDFDMYAGKDEVGAHVLGHNKDTIGICFIGTHTFTDSQLFMGWRLINFLINKIETLSIDNVIGHYQTDTGKAQGKTCPNFDVHEYINKYRNMEAPI